MGECAWAKEVPYASLDVKEDRHNQDSDRMQSWIGELSHYFTGEGLHQARLDRYEMSPGIEVMIRINI